MACFKLSLGRRLLPLLLLERINIVLILFLYVWPHVIGPFSTTLVPLSSSLSVDRQVLINEEASAISPDERTFGFIFTKIPFTRRSDEEEKRSRSLDQIARTFSLFAPPQIYFSTSRHCMYMYVCVYIYFFFIYLFVCKKLNPDGKPSNSSIMTVDFIDRRTFEQYKVTNCSVLGILSRTDRFNDLI